MGGDDAVELLNNGIRIDIIGEAGYDPGEGWIVASDDGDIYTTKDQTLVRSHYITNGTTIWTTGCKTNS